MPKGTEADLLPVAMVLLLLFGKNKDDNIANLAKQIITKTGFENKSEDLDASKKNNFVPPYRLRQPFHLPDLKEAKIEGKDLLVRFGVSNMQLVDIGKFTTTEKNDIGVGVNLNIESVNIFIMYSISGNIHGENFHHSGKTEVFLTEVVGDTQIEHVVDPTSGNIRIDNIRLNFDFKTLEFGQTGLVIKKISPTDLRRILNSIGKIYFKQNIKIASNKLSDLVKEQMNTVLRNKNREQIIRLLERSLDPPRDSLISPEENRNIIVIGTVEEEENDTDVSS